MIAGVADTHTALWHLFGDSKLSNTAASFISEAATARQKIAISSITLAELVYLVEKNRLPLSAEIVHSMRQVPRAEVPDMPDRMIAATAVYFKVPVLSRDKRILSANLETVW